MKFHKSKTSAVVLSAIVVITFAGVSAVVDILIPYLVAGDVSEGHDGSQFNGALSGPRGKRPQDQNENGNKNR